jgi:hypothetical protein
VCVDVERRVIGQVAQHSINGCVEIWSESPRASEISECGEVEQMWTIQVLFRGSMRVLAFDFEGRGSGPPSRFERLTT